MEENAKEIHIHIHVNQLVAEAHACNCCKYATVDVEKMLSETLINVIKTAGEIKATNQA